MKTFWIWTRYSVKKGVRRELKCEGLVCNNGLTKTGSSEKYTRAKKESVERDEKRQKKNTAQKRETYKHTAGEEEK